MRRDETLDPDDLDRPDWNSLKANYSKHDVGEAYLVGRLHQLGMHVEHWGIDMRDDDDGLIFDNKMDLRVWAPIEGQAHPPERWPSDYITDEPQAIRTLESAHTDDPSLIEAMREHPELDEDDIKAEFDVATWKCRGVVDVKTKSNEDWFGVLNLRHLAHYGHWAHEYSGADIPVGIFFTMVDMDSETVGERNAMIPAPTDWDWLTVMEHFDPNSDVTLDYPTLKEKAAESIAVERVFRAPDGNPVVRLDTSESDFEWFTEGMR